MDKSLNNTNMEESDWDLLMASDLTIKIFSRSLNAELWLVSNESHLTNVTDASPVYLMREVKAIFPCSKSELSLIHQIKTTFKGELVAEDQQEESGSGKDQSHPPKEPMKNPFARLLPTRKFLEMEGKSKPVHRFEKAPATTDPPGGFKKINSTQIIIEL